MAALTAIWKRRTQGMRTSCHILRSTEPMRGLRDAAVVESSVVSRRESQQSSKQLETHSP